MVIVKNQLSGWCCVTASRPPFETSTFHIREPVWVTATLSPIQSPNTASWKEDNDGSNAWASATHKRDPDGEASAWPSPNCCRHLENKMVDGKSSSFSLSANDQSASWKRTDCQYSLLPLCQEALSYLRNHSHLGRQWLYIGLQLRLMVSEEGNVSSSTSGRTTKRSLENICILHQNSWDWILALLLILASC